MLCIGSQTNKPEKRIEIDFDGLLHHTLVVGQSGSGKSFLIARLVEEILLRTRARVLIVDPNGDFRKVNLPSSSVWKQLKTTFNKFNDLNNSADAQSFDEEETFNAGWSKRRFTYLNPRGAAEKDTKTALYRRLYIQWGKLNDEQQRFLLNANPSTEPKVVLGFEACSQYAKWIEDNRPDIGYGSDLRGLQYASEQFALRNIGLSDYEYAKLLTVDDWYDVRAKISDLLSQHAVWWSRDRSVSVRPAGVSDFIDGAFDADTATETYWDSLILSLDAARPADTLLTVEVVLSRLWLRAKDAWRNRADLGGLTGEGGDARVPTFIVVDEAHNFAPERSSDPLRNRVTSQLLQIASEGRKYGLYLILATQRPTKLHRDLVPECENSCVLRVQSDLEIDFARKVLGIPEKNATSVPDFNRGQGLFAGRWVNSPVPLDTMIAPARTVVGGGGLSSGWKKAPSETPAVASIYDSVAQFVRTVIEDSPSPITLVSLANLLTEEFDQVRSGDWLGKVSLKNLLLFLDVEGLVLATEPPGYAYLEGIHSPPEPSEDNIQSSFSSTDLEAQLVFSAAHQSIGLPLIKKEAYRTILEEISKEVQNNDYNLTDTSKAVRDKCKYQEMAIGRNSINFVLKGISYSGHLFDPDLPQTPKVLAEAFARSITVSLRRSGIDTSSSVEEIILRHISGGLLEVDEP